MTASIINAAFVFRKYRGLGYIIVRMKARLMLVVSLAFCAACGLGPDMNRDRVQRTPSPTPWQGERPIGEYLSEANTAFAAKDYATALTPYKRALEIEQRQPQLEKKDWFRLVENLGTTHARLGSPKDARVVIAYGLSKDYQYPMFHYVLARIYGEEGSEAEALRHLRNAYRHRKNVIAGETIPDPLTDESFSGMANSETFTNAVTDMQKR